MTYCSMPVLATNVSIIYELMYQVSPSVAQYFMPIHGEYRMLTEHGNIAQSCDIPKENVFICQNGDVVELNNGEATKTGKVQAGDIYIDGNSESHFNPIGDSIKIYKLFSGYFAKLVLITILNLIIFNIILKIVTLPSIITVTFAIIIANLICNKLCKMKDIDIVNHIVYVTTLVILTLIFNITK